MSQNNFFNIISDIGQPKIEYLNQPIVTVVEYIEKQLPAFIQENKDKDIQNERGLTQLLIRILNSNLKDSYPFFFDKEGMQNSFSGNSPAVDLEAIAKIPLTINFRNLRPYEAFFALEAKILGVKQSHRLREYVIGFDEKNRHRDCGGIERFKKGIYSKELPIVGMIGYVLKHDFNYWNKQINFWIEELIEEKSNNSFWQSQDKLVTLDIDSTNIFKLKSFSRRRYNDQEISPVSIIHLWADLR